VRDLAEILLRHAGPDQSALPSVRALARFHGASPQTVHKALQRLRSRGIVHSIERKGYYWGTARKEEPQPPSHRQDRTARIRERLVSDLRCGVFHPLRDIPSPRALAQIYSTSPARIASILESLAHSGILIRRSRGFALAPPVVAVPRSTVLVVTRCDEQGKLIFDSERETDFMKSVHREGRELGMRIVVVGWHQQPSGGIFLDQLGRRVDPESLPGVFLGSIVSTWLILEPSRLLERIWMLRAPVSVWWEHPRGDFPRVHANHPTTVGFDLSFGPAAGIAVGRAIRGRNLPSVAFVSPFHGSEWSRARLDGLREGLSDSVTSVVDFADSRHENAWQFHQAGGVEAGEDAILAILRGFLDRGDLAGHPVWVAVNDHVAFRLLELVRERGLRRPDLVSFDNSTICDAYQIDSFEFHTEGMVRQMLYHLLHPTARLYQEGGLHEMVGRMVLRN
jgi:DNA-binding transcriptional regulator YhcF (GntR family)